MKNRIPLTEFLKPEVVSRLSRLDLIARLVVEGFITGLHRSPYHGFSVEFSEYRAYQPGDPLKQIDWKIWARTDRFYIKQFEEETNLKAYLLLDVSGSMAYGSGKITKLQYATWLCAALAYLMLLQRDAVGLALFDITLRRYLPPRSVFSYLSLLLQEMHHIKGKGDTDISTTFHRLAERIKRRGLIIILSDLLDEPERVLNAFKHFRHQKHEVIVFHILDPTESQLHFPKETLFIDMETGEKISTDPRYIAQSYHMQFEKFIDQYKRECREQNIDYVSLFTTTPFDQALFQYLIKRKRMG